MFLCIMGTRRSRLIWGTHSSRKEPECLFVDYCVKNRAINLNFRHYPRDEYGLIKHIPPNFCVCKMCRRTRKNLQYTIATLEAMFPNVSHYIYRTLMIIVVPNNMSPRDVEHINFFKRENIYILSEEASHMLLRTPIDLYEASRILSDPVFSVADASKASVTGNALKEPPVVARAPAFVPEAPVLPPAIVARAPPKLLQEEGEAPPPPYEEPPPYC